MGGSTGRLKQNLGLDPVHEHADPWPLLDLPTASLLGACALRCTLSRQEYLELLPAATVIVTDRLCVHG